jgi:hypothetical protein
MPEASTAPPQAVAGARVRARTSRLVLDAARHLVEQDGLEQLSMRRLAGASDHASWITRQTCPLHGGFSFAL